MTREPDNIRCSQAVPSPWAESQFDSTSLPLHSNIYADCLSSPLATLHAECCVRQNYDEAASAQVMSLFAILAYVYCIIYAVLPLIHELSDHHLFLSYHGTLHKIIAMRQAHAQEISNNLPAIASRWFHTITGLHKTGIYIFKPWGKYLRAFTLGNIALSYGPSFYPYGSFYHE